MDDVKLTEQTFLIYSRNDRQSAIALASALVQADIRVFRDEDAIRAGDNWMQRLQDALQSCAAFIVIDWARWGTALGGH